MIPLIKNLPFPPPALNGKRINVEIITTTERIAKVGVIAITELPGGFMFDINLHGSPARQISLHEDIANLVHPAPLGASYEFEICYPDVVSL